MAKILWFSGRRAGKSWMKYLLMFEHLLYPTPAEEFHNACLWAIEHEQK